MAMRERLMNIDKNFTAVILTENPGPLIPHLAGVSRGEKENAGSGRRMNGIALVFRIYHAFGQSMAGRVVPERCVEEFYRFLDLALAFCFGTGHHLNS